MSEERSKEGIVWQGEDLEKWHRSLAAAQALISSEESSER
jgi:hypothetical protein